MDISICSCFRCGFVVGQVSFARIVSSSLVHVLRFFSKIVSGLSACEIGIRSSC